MISGLIRFVLLFPKVKKKLIHSIFSKSRVENLFPHQLKSILRENVLRVVDIGGAVDLQPHWYKLVGAAEFYIFEPHPESFKDLNQKYSPLIKKGQFHIFPIALSGNGGSRTLFVTNTPTGSTIATLNKNSVYLTPSNGYLFPLKEVSLETQTLSTALAGKRIDFIKLDIQGAELEVLKGLGEKGINTLLGFEIEVHLQDAYVGATRLQDVIQYSEDHGFELFDIKVARTRMQRNGSTAYLKVGFDEKWEPSVSERAWELDVIFFKKPDQLLRNKDKPSILKLISCYCVYNFFLEAVTLVTEATDLNIFSKDEAEEIYRSCVCMKGSMDMELSPHAAVLKAQKNRNWGQYMWMTYPST